MTRAALADIRRREIIQAFFLTIAEKGLKGATIREVAEAADMSPGLLHRYFRDRDEMVSTVLEMAGKVVIKQLQKELSKGRTSTERLVHFLNWSLTIKEIDLQWFRVLDEFRSLARTNPSVARAVEGYYEAFRKRLVELIEEGKRTHEFRQCDSTVATNLIVATMDGMIDMILLNPKRLPNALAKKELVEMYKRYFGVS